MFSPGFSILAHPAYTPHENPVTAKSALDKAALLLSYGSVFNLATIRQYQDAQSLLKELELTNIPDELRHIADHYNRLSSRLLTTLNNIESLLDEASTLFSENQLSEGKEKLDSAEIAIHDAKLLLEDIETATITLSEELGIFAASAGSRIKQAYERLEQNLQRLGQLTNELNQLREGLELNPQMIIKTRFYYPTSLKFSAPEVAHPGLPITISGQVSSTGSDVSRTIKILLDNTQLAEERIQGKFSLEITPPEQTTTGKHSLTVVAAPQGCYSGTSRSLSIDISRIPLQADVQLPKIIITPKLIQASGKVFHNLSPVSDARVNLTFRQSSIMTKTATDGSFTAVVKPPQLSVFTASSSNFFYATPTMELPFDLSLVGSQKLTMTIQPIEPWYAPLQIETWTFVINPANMGLMLVIFFSFGLLVYNRVRARALRPQEERLAPQPPIQELFPTPLPPRPKYELADIKGRILSAYLSGLEAVEKKTGISMAAHTTLREFLNMATPQLPSVAKPFTELTTITEAALYSAHRLDEDTATKAEQLAATIKEELFREPA
jgi:hypothetical protein